MYMVVVSRPDNFLQFVLLRLAVLACWIFSQVMLGSHWSTKLHQDSVAPHQAYLLCRLISPRHIASVVRFAGTAWERWWRSAYILSGSNHYTVEWATDCAIRAFVDCDIEEWEAVPLFVLDGQLNIRMYVVHDPDHGHYLFFPFNYHQRVVQFALVQYQSFDSNFRSNP